jgi:hypothetical protein
MYGVHLKFLLDSPDAVFNDHISNSKLYSVKWQGNNEFESMWEEADVV